MRVRLRGLNLVTKTLADGTAVSYFYAWKGGPRLRGVLGSPEFIASYHEAVSTKRAPANGVIFTLLRASSEFNGLRDRTRADYVKQIKLIETAFGDMPIAALNARGARAEF